MKSINKENLKKAGAPSGPFMQSYRTYSTAVLMTVLLIPVFLLGLLIALIMDQKPVGMAFLGAMGIVVIALLVLWIIIIVQGFIYFANANERAADKIAAMTHKGLLQPGDLDSAYSKKSSQVLITKMEAASHSWKTYRPYLITLTLSLVIMFIFNILYGMSENSSISVSKRVVESMTQKIWELESQLLLWDKFFIHYLF